MFAKLLHLPLPRSAVLCGVRPDGPVCPGQCGGCSAHETLGGVTQAGRVFLLFFFLFKLKLF